MTKIIFVEHDGNKHVINAEIDKSVMQNALDNMVPGISGDCGGCCNCGTCHCYVDERWTEQLDAPSEAEHMMLEGSLNVLPNSRLTCQIIMKPDLDGIVLFLPE